MCQNVFKWELGNTDKKCVSSYKMSVSSHYHVCPTTGASLLDGNELRALSGGLSPCLSVCVQFHLISAVSFKLQGELWPVCGGRRSRDCSSLHVTICEGRFASLSYSVTQRQFDTLYTSLLNEERERDREIKIKPKNLFVAVTWSTFWILCYESKYLNAFVFQRRRLHFSSFIWLKVFPHSRTLVPFRLNLLLTFLFLRCV
jgi:hypothetical protein